MDKNNSRNDKVIYSVKTQHIYIYRYSYYYKLGDMFRFIEPSSGQFLIQSNGTFSECAHYGIPCCLQTICDIKNHYQSIFIHQLMHK